jgi:hypothetical protein
MPRHAWPNLHAGLKARSGRSEARLRGLECGRSKQRPYNPKGEAAQKAGIPNFRTHYERRILPPVQEQPRTGTHRARQALTTVTIGLYAKYESVAGTGEGWVSGAGAVVGTWGNAEGIDLFANICRHEGQHLQDMTRLWGN